MTNISINDELDQVIGAMISEPDAAIATENAKFADVLRIVSDLRDLPRPGFKTRLKLELEWVASSRPLSPARQPQTIDDSGILPSLFGNNYGTYPIQRVNFATSIALHAAAIVLVAVLGALAFKQKVNDVSQKTNLTVLSRYVPPLGLNEPKGGGGGVLRVGEGITPPRVVYDPDPEYSPEARAARYQGTVKLWAIIGPDGRPHNLRVERSVGMGLDEKAIEAVRNWRFKPATKDGQAVAVEIEVEVGFHLY